MFGRKKKASSQVYYQSSRFNRKLQDARGYKRVVRQSNRRSAWRKAKLNGRAIAGILAFALLVYLVYIPNFLYAKNVKFTGIAEQDLAAARAEVDDYFNASKFWPQQNLLLLSTGRLREFLVRPESALYEVRSAHRNFLRRELVIEASVKSASYLVITKAGSYIVNNDGTVKGEAVFTEPIPGLMPIRVPQANALQNNQLYLSQPLREALATFARDFPVAANAVIVSYDVPETGSAQIDTGFEESILETGEDAELPTELFSLAYETGELDPPEIIVHAKKNGPQPKGAAEEFRVYFALHSDLPHVIQQLGYLLSQLAPDRFNRLYYLDMRTENKSFVCLTRTPCAQEPLPVNVPTVQTAPATNTNQSPVNANSNR